MMVERKNKTSFLIKSDNPRNTKNKWTKDEFFFKDEFYVDT